MDHKDIDQRMQRDSSEKKNVIPYEEYMDNIGL